MQPKLTIVRGLPGSGKSTRAHEIAMKTGAVHFETDMFFMRDNGVYDYQKALINTAHDWCLRAARSQLAQGRDVVVANTFSTNWEMEPYFKLAHAHGAQIEVIECAGNFENTHHVPSQAIERMRARWENVETK